MMDLKKLVESGSVNPSSSFANTQQLIYAALINQSNQNHNHGNALPSNHSLALLNAALTPNNGNCLPPLPNHLQPTVPNSQAETLALLHGLMQHSKKSSSPSSDSIHATNESLATFGSKRGVASPAVAGGGDSLLHFGDAKRSRHDLVAGKSSTGDVLLMDSPQSTASSTCAAVVTSSEQQTARVVSTHSTATLLQASPNSGTSPGSSGTGRHQSSSNGNTTLDTSSCTLGTNASSTGDEQEPWHSEDSKSPPRLNAHKSCMTSDMMRQYLRDIVPNKEPFAGETGRVGDKMVVFQHAKVAQKSYGSEKRFFCPPPCFVLKGDGWQRNACVTRVMSFMGINGPEPNKITNNTPLSVDDRGVGVAKSLFISDSDKRKFFRLALNLLEPLHGPRVTATGPFEAPPVVSYGKFLSGNVKVISKPSKKKQSPKNTDLCIKSGSQVALFNRLRSQTVSTRYLFAENGKILASGTRWGSFKIYKTDNADNGEKFTGLDGFINYGDYVKLVCSDTNVALPKLIIRKVDKSDVICGADDLVSQLHKCCFQIADSDNQSWFVCLSGDKVIQHQAASGSVGLGAANSPFNATTRVGLNDGACWTIISTEQTRFTWCERFMQQTSLSLTSTPRPIAPVPRVTKISLNGHPNDVVMVELHGVDFSAELHVWFDNVEAVTYFRSVEILLCEVPDISAYKQEDASSGVGSSGDLDLSQVPLSLVRDDGVIYPTEIWFSYVEQGSSTHDKHSGMMNDDSIVDVGDDYMQDINDINDRVPSALDEEIEKRENGVEDDSGQGVKDEQESATTTG